MVGPAMIGASELLRPVTALVAVGLLVVFLTQGEDAAPSVASVVKPRLRVDATSDAVTRQLRRATHRLAAELGAAARCDVRQSTRPYEACVSPALQHTGIGGRGTAMILGNVAAGVPAGHCLNYLVGLQAANGAAADNARWLVGNMYDYRGPEGRRRLARQLRLTHAMLRRAARAAPPDVCEPGGGQPAI
jgi:hypothetical protein